MLGLPAGDTDPMLDDMSDGEPDFDEPIELVEARARLAELAEAQGPAAMLDLVNAAQAASAGHAIVGTGDQQESSAAAQTDARDYFASVRECQALLDSNGPALMASAQGDVGRLPGVRAAGEAALAAISAGSMLGVSAPAAAAVEQPPVAERDTAVTTYNKSDQDPAGAADEIVGVGSGAAVSDPVSSSPTPPTVDEEPAEAAAAEWGSGEPSGVALAEGLSSHDSEDGGRSSSGRRSSSGLAGDEPQGKEAVVVPEDVALEEQGEKAEAAVSELDGGAAPAAFVDLAALD